MVLIHEIGKNPGGKLILMQKRCHGIFAPQFPRFVNFQVSAKLTLQIQGLGSFRTTAVVDSCALGKGFDG